MQTQLRAEPTAKLNYHASFLLLPKALAELSYWHDQKNRHGCGEITLNRCPIYWSVTVSDDLASKVIPF